MNLIEKLITQKDLYEGKGILGKIFNYKRRQIYEWIISQLKDKEASILDIGTADGFLIQYFKARRYKDVIGADINPQNNKILKIDIENINLRDNSYDYVLAIGLLEHLYEPTKALKEIRRIARKGIIVNVPNEPYFSTIIGNYSCHIIGFTPAFLEHHLGKSTNKAELFFKRELMMFWNLKSATK